jgi:hypothetical protein
MYLQEIQCEDMDWIHLAEDRDYEWNLLDTIMNIWISCKARNVLCKNGAVGSYVLLWLNKLILGKTNVNIRMSIYNNGLTICS